MKLESLSNDSYSSNSTNVSLLIRLDYLGVFVVRALMLSLHVRKAPWKSRKEIVLTVFKVTTKTKEEKIKFIKLKLFR